MLSNEIKSFDRYIKIDLDAICANAREIRSHLKDGCQLMAVVKADAYGLGAVSVADAIQDDVDAFAVTYLHEGIELRQAGINKPILVFMPVRVNNAALLRQYQLTATIDSIESMEALAVNGDGQIPCQIKVNTGMNRFGCSPETAAALGAAVTKSSSLQLTGIYSHLAEAADKNSAERQITVFSHVIDAFKEMDIDYGTAHIANSIAVLTIEKASFDMVRVGTLLYGQSPVQLPNDWHLANPWLVDCKISAIRKVKKGELIGYGGDSKADRDLTLAMLPIGYADGFAVETDARSGTAAVFKKAARNIAGQLTNKPAHYALFEGKRMAVVGRVAMQTCAVDITGYSLNVGDIIEIAMRRTTSDARLPRVYYRGGQICAIRNIDGVYMREDIK